MLGMSHHTASVAVRERSGLAPNARQQLLTDTRRFEGGLVVLSTCNRTELYATVHGTTTDAKAILLELWSAHAGTTPALLQPHLVYLEGQAAVRHLCRVAAGLESLVLGEPQILGQVSDALNHALAHRRADAWLKALFQTALRSGKRARTETGISRNPVSISSMAVRMAAQRAGGLADKHVAVIGAGEMARLALKVLTKEPPARLTVLNRDPGRAAALADRFHATPRSLAELPAMLTEIDILISATAAPHLILDYEAALPALDLRRERPLYVIDIALPRDVDPALAAHPLVHLFDLDTLDVEVRASLLERQKEIPRVEALIEEELAQFERWCRQHTVNPVIATLRRKAEQIRLQEVERVMASLPDASPEVREQLQHFSRALVKKLLHNPTVRLRDEALNGQVRDYAEAIRYLFCLDDTPAS